mgnify:CR=1 FL=1
MTCALLLLYAPPEAVHHVTKVRTASGFTKGYRLHKIIEFLSFENSNAILLKIALLYERTLYLHIQSTLLYIYIYICIHIYIYIYIHIHIHSTYFKRILQSLAHSYIYSYVEHILLFLMFITHIHIHVYETHTHIHIFIYSHHHIISFRTDSF